MARCLAGTARESGLRQVRVVAGRDAVRWVQSIDHGTIEAGVLHLDQDRQPLVKVNAPAVCDAGIQASETQVFGITAHREPIAVYREVLVWTQGEAQIPSYVPDVAMNADCGFASPSSRSVTR